MNSSHPWHLMSAGKNVPDSVNGIIEIPKNTIAKYEIDKESGLLKFDQVLFSAMHHPVKSGFILQSYCDDNGQLDILILSQFTADYRKLMAEKK